MTLVDRDRYAASSGSSYCTPDRIKQFQDCPLPNPPLLAGEG